MHALLQLTSILVSLARTVGGDPAVVADMIARAGSAGPRSVAEGEAELIDAASHQKYASVSGLYWYTDLPSAEAAARAHGKPILHLRMLGRLDEDLSCANSRLFRATLYANAELAGFLRESFILYWSSERPVPHVTIDFGDGRTIETTATGNSAHYVIDADGRILDVLPGLYTAAAFRAELEDSLALAAQVRAASDADRTAAIVAYHEHKSASAAASLAALEKVRVRASDAGASEIEMGQRMTMTKAVIEVRPLRTLGAVLREKAYSADEVALWATAAATLYPRPPAAAEGPVLDDRSRALVLRLHAGTLPADLRGTDAQQAAVVTTLERHILADTALDQLVLRPQISREIVRRGGTADFASLNAWIYASVFHTAAADPWLGLVPRTVFTGLPGDGVVLP